MRHAAFALLSPFLGVANASAGEVKVPGGVFSMGCSSGDGACEKDEGPAGGTQVDVPSFRIGTHAVTVAEYRACIEASRCPRPKDHARNKYGDYDAPGRDRHPINCVD